MPDTETVGQTVEDDVQARAAELMLRLEAELREPLVEGLQEIAKLARRARRSGRRAQQIPQASFDAALELVEALARGALGGDA